MTTNGTSETVGPRRMAQVATVDYDACPFCDFRRTVLYRGEGNIVFEPLNPVTEGHVLVVPKMHVRDAAEEPTIAASAMRLAGWWVKYKVEGPANIITSIGREATQTVMHLHLHVVPRHEGDGLALPWTGQEKP